jgi:hypothetical protein
VSLRDVEVAVLDLQTLAGELVVSAARVHASDEAWQYQFTVTCGDRRLATGRATVAIRSG